MRFLLGGFGTRGDVQPMLALALTLRDRGHQVTAMGPPDFAPRAATLGLAYAAMGESMSSLIGRISDRKGNLKLGVALGAMSEFLRSQFALMEPLVREADVVATSSLSVAGVSLAEWYGKRFHQVAFCPQIIPSGEHPNTLVRSHTLPRWLNRFSWWLGARGHDLTVRKMLDAERARLGLPPSGDVYEHTVFQRLIVASEPTLAPLPADRPARHPIAHTGAVFMPEPEPVSAELERFLAAGPPPVYVGFGSMSDQAPADLLQLVLQAAQAAGARVLIAQPAAGREVPASARFVGEEPHGKLFPRCAAVVHHGGAGTTATAARAGVPQVLVPHVSDQHFWAHRLFRLGLCPAPVPRRRLDGRALGAAMRACLEDAALRERAATFAKGMIVDGALRAARALEGEPVAPAPGA